MINWIYPEFDDWGLTSIIISEDGIVEFYWEYWSTQMLKVHKAPMITRQNCIDDFVVVHWARKVE